MIGNKMHIFHCRGTMYLAIDTMAASHLISVRRRFELALSKGGFLAFAMVSGADFFTFAPPPLFVNEGLG
jgi:hypothetical protein